MAAKVIVTTASGIPGRAHRGEIQGATGRSTNGEATAIRRVPTNTAATQSSYRRNAGGIGAAGSVGLEVTGNGTATTQRVRQSGDGRMAPIKVGQRREVHIHPRSTTRAPSSGLFSATELCHTRLSTFVMAVAGHTGPKRPKVRVCVKSRAKLFASFARCQRVGTPAGLAVPAGVGVSNGLASAACGGCASHKPFCWFL